MVWRIIGGEGRRSASDSLVFILLYRNLPVVLDVGVVCRLTVAHVLSPDSVPMSTDQMF